MGREGCTIILLYDMGKLARHPAGALVVRLAMALNDIVASNTFLRWSREHTKDRDLGMGLAMYAVRLEIAHTAEASHLVAAVAKSPSLARLHGRLPEEARRSLDRLTGLLRDADDKAPFRGRMKKVRDKVTFHYDAPEVAKALQCIAQRAAARRGKVTLGPEMHRCRINLADRVLDRLVSSVLWGEAPAPEDTYQQRVDDVVEWCQKVTMDFVGWATPLCIAFLEEHCSAA